MKTKERKLPEIVVSTYWPTRIIKSVTIKDTNKDYSNDITLSASEAKYLFEQLGDLYSSQENKEEACSKKS